VVTFGSFSFSSLSGTPDSNRDSFSLRNRAFHDLPGLGNLGAKNCQQLAAEFRPAAQQRLRISAPESEITVLRRGGRDAVVASGESRGEACQCARTLGTGELCTGRPRRCPSEPWLRRPETCRQPVPHGRTTRSTLVCTLFRSALERNPASVGASSGGILTGPTRSVFAVLNWQKPIPACLWLQSGRAFKVYLRRSKSEYCGFGQG
jgi:hypothetical protein